MADDGLSDAMEKWNPMEEAYLNEKFNAYDTGPGSALDPALQPAALARGEQDGFATSSQRVYPYLIFADLPKGMTARSVKNLCERYTQVKDIENAQKHNSVYVKFFGIADLEVVHRAFVKNNYGFKVLIGKVGSRRAQNFDEIRSSPVVSEPPPPVPAINVDHRTVRPSGKTPRRPNLTKENLNEFKEENLALSKNDPIRKVIEQDDCHGLERANADVPKIKVQKDDEYEYRTGRAFLKMPEKLRDHLLEAHKKSNGTYNAAKDQYSMNGAIPKKPSDVQIHRCIVCDVPADISCYRCNPKLFIYCGRKCQNDDWEQHRKICGRRNGSTSPKTDKPKSSEKSSPDLRNLSGSSQTTKKERTSSFSSTNSSQSKSFDAQSFPKPDMPAPNAVVAMTAVSNTNLVFIRSRSKEDDLKFFETISKIQASAKNFKKWDRLPQVGQAVIAKFQNSHEYGRALILKVIDEDNVKVNFLDYGNIEVQKLSSLYKAKREFIELPRFAIPVILKDVPTHYMTMEVRSFMYSYLRNINLIVKYDKEKDLLPMNNVYQVDLYDESTNQHLNKTIAELCKPQQPKNCDELASIDDLEIKPLPVGKDIEYYIMDNSELKVGCISCTTVEYALEIEKFSDDIQRYANACEVKSYAPREQELCIAKYSRDGVWYRGCCVEKVGDGNPTIQFIDYGNLEYVKVTDIRPYPLNFTWPRYTADFGIEALPEEINEKMVDKLEELLRCCYPIKCDRVEKDAEENFYTATLSSVIQELKDEGLLDD